MAEYQTFLLATLSSHHCAQGIFRIAYIASYVAAQKYHNELTSSYR